MVLTTSYQKIVEKKLGSWGYGTLYLRIYAKYNSQSTTNNNTSYSVQERIYNNGTVCNSGNCYANLMRTNLKDNASLTFTGNAEITLGTVTKTVNHNVDGSKSVSISGDFKCYALNSTKYTASATVDMPKINRMDIATGLDFDIGSTTNINITRYNEDYTRTVVASIGSYSETLMTKGTDTLISWTPTASDLYGQVINSNIGTITLSCTTYDGNTQIGTVQTRTIKCRVTDSNPTISGTTETDLDNLVSGYVLRYKSNVQITISAVAQNFATISSYIVTPKNASSISGNSNQITVGSIANNEYNVTVVDSRGNTGTYSGTVDNFIEYIKPVIKEVNADRTGENLDQIAVSLSGEWFNQNLGSNPNVMLLRYKYREHGTETWSDETSLPHSITSSLFTYDAILSITDGFDTTKVYELQFIINDNIDSNNLNALIGKAIPLTDYWEDDNGEHYNINAEVQQNGIPLRPNQNKILWNGTPSYMNATQSIDLSELVSDQATGIVLVWSGYADGSAQNYNWNYTFVPKQHVQYAPNAGVSCVLGGASFNPIGNKYVYVSDTQITGHASNNQTGTTNGIAWANNKFVLRYVLGV